MVLQRNSQRQFVARLFGALGLTCGGLILFSAIAVATPAATLEEIQALIQNGDLAAARNGLNEILQSSSHDPNAWNMLGVVEAQQGDYPGAESSFQKAINLAPRLTGAYLNLGRLYQENTKKDPAALTKGVLTYERLLKFEPANSEANFQCAFLLTQLGSFQASLDHLTRLPVEDQDRNQALAVRCADYGGLNRQSEAAATAERLLRSPDLQEADVVTILPPLMARHRDTIPMKLLEGLAQRHLASSSTLVQLAALYQSSGELERARSTLEVVAQNQESVSVPLLLDLAHVAYKQQDFNGALGYLAHAREIEPNNAGVHFFFGMVCVELNLTEEAFRSLKKATDLNPNNPYYNYAFAAAIMNRESVKEAYPFFKKYCEEKPGDPRGHLALGSAYFYGHDLDLSRKELDGLVSYPQTSATAHYFLGRIADREGNLTEAKSEILKALQIRSQYADAYGELGVIELKLKDYPSAGEALRKAIEITPDSYTANLNLTILYQRTRDSRADAQSNRLQEISQQRNERQREFLRTIEVTP
jgi:tetratricopeptide (TPR) repeat protein